MWKEALVGLVLADISLYFLAMILPAALARYCAFYARSIASFSMILVCSAYGVVASIVLRAVGYGGLSQWTVARSFKWTLWATTGATFRIVKGEEYLSEKYNLEDASESSRKAGRRARVIVGNHQPELDVLLLGCIFPKYTSVTAKSSLKYVPFLGWFMALSRTVFIDRANSSSARAAFAGAATTLSKTHQSVFIFPEGTRSYASKPTLLPFKKGAFHLAVQAQVPVLPVVCANYHHVLDVKGKLFNAGSIPVSVLEPIETKGLGPEDVEGLTNRVRDAMLAEIERLGKVVEEQTVRKRVGINGLEKSKGSSTGVDGFKGLAVGGRQ